MKQSRKQRTQKALPDGQMFSQTQCSLCVCTLTNLHRVRKRLSLGFVYPSLACSGIYEFIAGFVRVPHVLRRNPEC